MTALTFRDTRLDVIDRNGQRWLTAEQIGLALGYAPDNARKGVIKLFNTHSDEFTEADTFVAVLATNSRGNPNTRLFSSSGCILLGFFANTARAKEFRVWAKQVLAAQPAPTPAAPVRGANGRVLITRAMERQVLELFVAGWRQRAIAAEVGLSAAAINLLLHAKYQFSPAAGEPQCSPELLAAVAVKHLQNEQARLIEQQQRLAQRFCNSAHNQPLADQLDRIGRHLQQAAAVALLPLSSKDGEQ
ncbi:BRO-N domain-containing protein [Ectopseudomonas oleovorans]|uniref:BRO-N domain-containing protein n=1 Tax=Ectopseudomonas oleovorans TaxID=301 RepID=UPI00244CCB61|nr:BRO family protein [Pseudomonas oleovorans]MDH2197890.1 BRO family protein [Pseudomonas oleovorans]